MSYRNKTWGNSIHFFCSMFAMQWILLLAIKEWILGNHIISSNITTECSLKRRFGNKLCYPMTGKRFSLTYNCAQFFFLRRTKRCLLAKPLQPIYKTPRIVQNWNMSAKNMPPKCDQHDLRWEMIRYTFGYHQSVVNLLLLLHFYVSRRDVQGHLTRPRQLKMARCVTSRRKV